jgi:cell division protein FtsL
MNKSLYLFSALVLVILTLTIVHVVVSNMLSTTGIELDTLQTDLTHYKKENVILQEQVLDQSSLSHIASAAAGMGFISEKSPVVIQAPLPLAKR